MREEREPGILEFAFRRVPYVNHRCGAGGTGIVI
jgi:hypothetical protein